MELPTASQEFRHKTKLELRCTSAVARSLFDRAAIQLPLVTGWNSMDEKTEESVETKKNLSACDVEALRKCLEENNGDRVKCQSQIQAFKSSCSLKKPTPSLQSGRELKTGV